MVETTASIQQRTSQREQDSARQAEPLSLGARLRHTLSRVGNNIDLINLYARQKDWYKIFEVTGAVIAYGAQRIASSLAGGAKDVETTAEHLVDNAKQVLDKTDDVKASFETFLSDFKKFQQEKQSFGALKSSTKLKGQLFADGANTALQMGLSEFSTWWEKNQLLRVYGESLKQEFGTQQATYDDLKRSKNPIIRKAADYYERKALWRSVPDYFGLVKVVPHVLHKAAEAIAPNSRFGRAMHGAEETINKMGFTGIDLSLGLKTLYFLWYFIERQTGGNYELMKIWNKTEGVKNAANLSVNQNVHPGELVTQEEITGLYREVAHERKLRDFSPYDPLTGRIFEQIARYINHNYMPDLYEVKRPTLKHEELAGTHFTHADLVALFGTAGIDINDAYATALRVEVLARKGMDDYRLVNQQIDHLHRPDPSQYANNALFGEALSTYIQQLDSIAKHTLGDVWPAPYIANRILPGIYKSYGLANDTRSLSKILSSETLDKPFGDADVPRVAPTMPLGQAAADAGQPYGETRIAQGGNSAVAADAALAENERRLAPTMPLGDARVEGGFADKVGARESVLERDRPTTHAQRAEESQQAAESRAAGF